MEQHTQGSRKFKGSTAIGILFLVIGGLWLAKLSGYPLPEWLFTWQMILIVVGLFTGIKSNFRDFSWLILMIIGFAFLSDRIWPALDFQKYMWPAIIITLGLIFIFAPKGPCRRSGRFRRGGRFGEGARFRHGFHEQQSLAGGPEQAPGLPSTSDPAADDPEVEPVLATDFDIVSIFGGVKKKVLSKQFIGGDIVCIFGGAQINLANADFKSPIVLDLVQIFGGTKLVVPSNWEIRSEIAAIFGGVDDKRPQPANSDPEKTVILKGTLVFGGVEVSSF